MLRLIAWMTALGIALLVIGLIAGPMPELAIPLVILGASLLAVVTILVMAGARRSMGWWRSHPGDDE